MKVPRPILAPNLAFLLQDIQGLPQRGPRQAEPSAKHPLWWQAIVQVQLLIGQISADGREVLHVCLPEHREPIRQLVAFAIFSCGLFWAQPQAGRCCRAQPPCWPETGTA